MYLQGADQREHFPDTAAFLDLVGKLAAGAKAVAGAFVDSGQGQSEHTVAASGVALFDERVRPCTALLRTACVPVFGSVKGRVPRRFAPTCSGVIQVTQTTGLHVAIPDPDWVDAM